MWVEYEISVLEADEWLLKEYMEVASLSLTSIYTHSSPMPSFISLHVVNTFRPQTQLPPPPNPWTWAACPQTFHTNVNFPTCSDDQAVCEQGLGSADLWDEAHRCARRSSDTGAECVRADRFHPQTLTCNLHFCRTPFRLKVRQRFLFFFLQSISHPRASSTHICGNDHSGWAVTAVSTLVRLFNWLL